jgi:hypothetical protein
LDGCCCGWCTLCTATVADGPADKQGHDETTRGKGIAVRAVAADAFVLLVQSVAEALGVALASLCIAAPAVEQRLRELQPGRGRLAAQGNLPGSVSLFALAPALGEGLKKVCLSGSVSLSSRSRLHSARGRRRSVCQAQVVTHLLTPESRHRICNVQSDLASGHHENLIGALQHDLGSRGGGRQQKPPLVSRYGHAIRSGCLIFRAVLCIIAA